METIPSTSTDIIAITGATGYLVRVRRVGLIGAATSAGTMLAQLIRRYRLERWARQS